MHCEPTVNFWIEQHLQFQSAPNSVYIVAKIVLKKDLVIAVNCLLRPWMWVCYYSVDKTHFRQENCSRRFHLETCFKANYYYCILCVAIPKDKGNSTSVAPRNHWLPQNFAPQTSGKVGTVKQGTWRFRMSIWKGNFMAFCFCSGVLFMQPLENLHILQLVCFY